VKDCEIKQSVTGDEVIVVLQRSSFFCCYFFPCGSYWGIFNRSGVTDV